MEDVEVVPEYRRLARKLPGRPDGDKALPRHPALLVQRAVQEVAGLGSQGRLEGSQKAQHKQRRQCYPFHGISFLFVPKRIERVELRRLPRRVEGGGEAYQHCRGRNRDELVRVHPDRQMAYVIYVGGQPDEVRRLYENAEQVSAKVAYRRADQAYHRPVYHENLHYPGTGCAHGLEDSYLARLFHDDHDKGADDVERRYEDDEHEYHEHRYLLKLQGGEEVPVHLLPVAGLERETELVLY